MISFRFIQRQNWFSLHKVADVLTCCSHLFRSCIGGIVQRTVFQQVVLEVSRVQFADERTIHVEGRDAVGSGLLTLHPPNNTTAAMINGNKNRFNR